MNEYTYFLNYKIWLKNTNEKESEIQSEFDTYTDELFEDLYKYLIVFNDFRNEMLLLEMLQDGEDSHLDYVEKAIHNRNYTTYDFRAVGETTSTLTDEAFILDSTIRSQSYSLAYLSRNSIISLNFHFESICIRGKGTFPG